MLGVAVLSGGRTSEHEASVASAAAVCQGLNEAGHRPVRIDVDRDGIWWREGTRIEIAPGHGLVGADVVFSTLQGPFGEDGAVQGLLECLGIPYVGAGVLASAVSQNKVRFKELIAAAGMPQVAYRVVDHGELQSGTEAVLDSLACLGAEVFVKPANQGSSVGISRAGRPQRIVEALQAAFEYGPRAIVERAATGLEVECGVIGNGEPIASLPGEIVFVAPEPGWFDYRTKYTPGSIQLIVPGRLPPHVRDRVQRLAVETFQLTGCTGLARVDFFVDREQILINEINTMPVLKKTSAFPLLFARSGIDYPALVDWLVQLALERHAERATFRY
jgi:D-alanine-D-alanine ligase